MLTSPNGSLLVHNYCDSGSLGFNGHISRRQVVGRRYMAEILPIRRKTQSNQSIRVVGLDVYINLNINLNLLYKYILQRDISTSAFSRYSNVDHKHQDKHRDKQHQRTIISMHQHCFTFVQYQHHLGKTSTGINK